MKIILVAVSSLFLIFLSCKKDSSGGSTIVDCSAVTNKAFAADINPIIQASCNISGCHAAGSFNGPGPLTNHAQVSAAASTIRLAVSSGRMPQGSSLSAPQKNSILCWIDSGAPNN
jgi:hypothetical protein